MDSVLWIVLSCLPVNAMDSIMSNGGGIGVGHGADLGKVSIGWPNRTIGLNLGLYIKGLTVYL